ncbi:MAG TPA: MFS transporter [Kofleriaceae bacterium]|nr:MFS transporter [Kofleriaceae bacterium]
MSELSSFRYRRVLLLGCGFMGISILWAIFDAFAPILLQAGRSDYSTRAGADGYGLSPGLTGVVMSLDNMAALFILPYVGALSDRLRTRWGRRKPFIAAGAPVGAAAFVCIPLALGQPLWVFMAAIIGMLLAMDLFRTPTVALMPDITPSPKRSIGNAMINVMGGLGGVLGQRFGGQLFDGAPLHAFLFGAAGMLIGVAVVLLFIREPAPEDAGPAEEAEPSLLASLKAIVHDADASALRILMAIFFWFLGHEALKVNFTSFAVNDLGVSSGEAAQTMQYFSGALLLFAVPGGLLGQRFGRRRVILVAIVVLSTLLGSCWFLETITQAKVMLGLIGSAWIVMVVNSLPMVVDCAPPRRIGTYTGLYYVASQSSAVIGPIAGGQIIGLFGNDYRVMFPYAALTLLLAGAAMWGVRRGEAIT